MPTDYRSKASPILRLRATPNTTAAVLARVPPETLLHTDRMVDGELVTGFDDPHTPEPAHHTRGWVHVTGYTEPAGAHHTIDAYASLAWLVREDPPAGLTFLHTPRISRERFRAVLAHSPALPEADACYDICVSTGLDPAVALAFFRHESSYGTQGRAIATRNWGNIRRSQGRAKAVVNGFAMYASWADSLADWCELIKARYVGHGLTTVEAAIPVYAPSSDGNAPARYIAAVRAAVAAWEE